MNLTITPALRAISCRNFLARLASADLKIWGNEWDGSPSVLQEVIQEGGRRVSTEETVQIFNASQINLNVHSSTCHGFSQPMRRMHGQPLPGYDVVRVRLRTPGSSEGRRPSIRTRAGGPLPSLHTTSTRFPTNSRTSFPSLHRTSSPTR